MCLQPTEGGHPSVTYEALNPTKPNFAFDLTAIALALGARSVAAGQLGRAKKVID